MIASLFDAQAGKRLRVRERRRRRRRNSNATQSNRNLITHEFGGMCGALSQTKSSFLDIYSHPNELFLI